MSESLQVQALFTTEREVKCSEDGEAETETCRAAKPLWRTMTRTSGPQGPNLLNRPMRTRMSRWRGRGEQVIAPPIPIKNFKKSLPPTVSAQLLLPPRADYSRAAPKTEQP
jgi:hypothetical protein